MSQNSDSFQADSPDLSDYPNIREVVTRVEAAENLTHSFELYDDSEDGVIPTVVVHYPQERGTRSVEYDEEDAGKLLAVEFETARFLPHTGGVVFRGQQTVEVQVRVRRATGLAYVPGARIDSPSGTSSSRMVQYKIRVGNHRGCFLEISRPTSAFGAINAGGLLRRGYTLKVVLPKRRLPSSSRDLEDLVREVGLAFFFELDLRYGISVDFIGAPGDSYDGWQDSHPEKPSYPKVSYPMQALSLYQYARGAIGLPLLAFLGYYQVLEFFFPVFSQRLAVQRVRQVIKHPRFALSSDQAVLDLVLSARAGGGGNASERQQLLGAVEFSVRPDQVLEYLQSSEEVEAYFTAKKQPLPGMSPLRIADAENLLKQVADRIYDIRCRIVHTKADGGDGAVELLLPDSAAVRQLGPDVELARLLAQYALVAGAEPLELK